MGAFLSLTGDEAYKALDKLFDNSHQWDFSSYWDKFACIPKKGGNYELKVDTELNMKIDAFTKKVDALVVGKSINAANTFNIDSCSICTSLMPLAQNCLSMPSLTEHSMEQVNAFNDYWK